MAEEPIWPNSTFLSHLNQFELKQLIRAKMTPTPSMVFYPLYV
jgi:hypothetical protein